MSWYLTSSVVDQVSKGRSKDRSPRRRHHANLSTVRPVVMSRTLPSRKVKVFVVKSSVDPLARSILESAFPSMLDGTVVSPLNSASILSAACVCARVMPACAARLANPVIWVCAMLANALALASPLEMKSLRMALFFRPRLLERPSDELVEIQSSALCVAAAALNCETQDPPEIILVMFAMANPEHAR